MSIDISCENTYNTAMLNVQYFFVRHYDYKRKIVAHEHDIYEFIYYLSGEGVTEIDGRKYTFGKDSFCLIPPHCRHSETHTGYSSVFAAGFEFTNEKQSAQLFFSDLQNQTVSNLISAMRKENQKKRPLYEQMIAAHLCEIIIHILRIPDRTDAVPIHDAVANALAYIDQYYMTNINLQEIAASAGYCADRFRNIFKSRLGITPKRYILDKRLEQAEHLLVQTDLPLQEIAASVGFEYYSRFSLFFKEKTGLSPQAYREKNHVLQIQ